MRDYLQFYIDGAWVTPAGNGQLDVINPATESVAGHIALGNADDVDKAVMAARRAARLKATAACTAAARLW